MNTMEDAIKIIEKYLSDNFWFTHFYNNGYPTKVIAKADFLNMLSELKKSIISKKSTFLNVYEDEDGRFIGDSEYETYEEAFDNRDNLSTYRETIEVVRPLK